MFLIPYSFLRNYTYFLIEQPQIEALATASTAGERLRHAADQSLGCSELYGILLVLG